MQSSEKTQPVEFSSSVALLTFSSNGLEQLLEPPSRVSTELPADFFYPFSGGKSGVCLAWAWLVGVGINVIL